MAEEIEIAEKRVAAARRDLKRLEPGKADLGSSPVFVVLDDGVMRLQLVHGSYDVIGAKTDVIEFAKKADFPVIGGLVNQSRLREHAFQPQFIGKKPDKAAARGDDRILVERAAETDYPEDLVLLKR